MRRSMAASSGCGLFRCRLYAESFSVASVSQPGRLGADGINGRSSKCIELACITVRKASLDAFEAVKACDTRSCMATEGRIKCCHSAKAGRDHQAPVSFHTPNSADQHSSITPSWPVLSPDKSKRVLSANKLTALPGGLFDGLGSLKRL